MKIRAPISRSSACAATARHSLKLCDEVNVRVSPADFILSLPKIQGKASGVRLRDLRRNSEWNAGNSDGSKPTFVPVTTDQGC